MATIQDIADEVGISKAAVSRILNRKGSFNVDTIEKVFHTAKSMNYNIPGESNSIEDKDFKIIAAVFPQENVMYYSILASFLEQAAYSYGYSLMICNSLYSKEKEEVFFDRLREKKINGIIYGSFTARVSIKEEENLPIVTIGQKISDKIPVVRSDNYSAGVIAARHLIGKGCRKFLYISGYQLSKHKDERYKGFLTELEKSDAELCPYFTRIDEKMSDVPSAITQMLIDHPDADAIFAESYTLTIQCIKVCSILGMKIPEHIKIVGYGNSSLSPYSFPEFSFVCENTKQIAQFAVARLVDMIEDEISGEQLKDNEIIVPVSFEQKQTT